MMSRQKDIEKMSRQELEQYCRQLEQRNLELFERRSAEFEMDKSWGTVVPESADKSELEKAQASIKLQRKKIDKQKREIDTLRAQIKDLEYEMGLTTENYQSTLKEAGKAAELRREELKKIEALVTDQEDEILKYQKSLEKARLFIQHQHERSEKEKAKHSKLVEFSERINLENVKLKQQLEAISKKAQELGGSLAISQNFQKQVTLANFVADLLRDRTPRLKENKEPEPIPLNLDVEVEIVKEDSE